MTASAPTRPPVSDGRTARSERTRTAIADAMLSLFEDGNLRPTGPLVAERAGVSLRTVFQHFADIEAIHATVADRQIERLLASVRFIPRDRPLGERIRLLTAERARMHEAITPVRRAALLVEPFSPGIETRLQWIRERGLREVASLFRSELETLPTAKRREVTSAVAVASAWSTWEALRKHQGLSIVQAQSVMRRTISSLFKEE